MKFYCLGPEGTYGHEAAVITMARRGLLDDELVFCKSNLDVILSVESGEGIGVAPIENSSAGLVSDVIRFWLDRKNKPIDVCAIGEIEISIHHQLLAHPSLKITDIKKVASHPQALSQCAGNLSKFNLGRTQAEDSTALAAKLASEPLANPNIAAIASKFAADVYGLNVLARDFNDFPANSTRFHVIVPHGDLTGPPSGYDRTAMIFEVRNEPKALLRPLLALSGVNISSIHSIPLGVSGKYAFYCEFEEHVNSDQGRGIIKELEQYTEYLFIIGSYPKGM